VRLDELPLRQGAEILDVDWDALPASEARRLRELGFGAGVRIEVRHRSGWLSRGPLACQVGRMLIALRQNHAAAISVMPS